MSIAMVNQFLVEKLKAATGDMTLITDGQNFTPKGLQDYPFARFALLPRETVQRDIGGRNIAEEAGLVAINIYFSRNINSITDALVLAEMIKAQFPVSNNILDNGNQLIIQAAWIETVRHEDAAFGVPIFIRWLNIA